MNIIGIDPGTASTGYGIIKIVEVKAKKYDFECLDYGLIKTDPVFAAPERLKKINNDLNKLLKKYSPKILVMESLYFFRNFKTAIPVSQASGVILLTAAKKNIPVYTFTPLQVKMTIAGHGWAEKVKVQKRIKNLLKLKTIPKPDDAADALAIALTFLLKESGDKTLWKTS